MPGAKRTRAKNTALHGLLELVPCPAWVEQKGSLLFANAGACELFGISRRRSRKTIAMAELVHWAPPLPPATRKGQVHRGQVEVVAGPEAGKRCEVVSRALTLRPARWLHLAWELDRTLSLESRLAEETQARAKAEATVVAQEAWVSLGTLVGRVAHDLRNPLFGITSTLDALEAHLGSTAPPEFFAVLRGETSRLERIVAELLAYARAGVSRPQQEAQVAELIHLALRNCAEQIRRKQLSVRVECPRSLPPVTVDSEDMVQAITNVLENAIQYAPKESKLTLAAAEEERGGELGVRIAVMDRGPGFSSEALPHVFEPFFSRRSGGTGLGLAIAARVVARHGGQIAAANRAQGGGQVDIWLPASKKSL